MENTDHHKQHELEVENRRLRERLDALEVRLGKNKKIKANLYRLAVSTLTGKPLYNSVSQLIDELYDARLERNTLKNALYATLHRLTRVGTITLLLALAPLSLAVLQTYYLKKQNEKFDIQNKRIEQQTYLQEAERRSSFVFLFDNVLNRIDDELKQNPVRRQLSPQLVGRIVALSKALLPYRFLEGDSITAKMTSPERGQLLLSLVASKLHPDTYEKIFLLADFSYATLEKVSLDGAYLRNINLSNVKFQYVSLSGADLTNSNLEGAELSHVRASLMGSDTKGASFNFANFHNARIENSDFSSCTFEFSNFDDATLKQVVFRQALFNECKFQLLRGDSLDFRQATAFKTRFSLPEKHDPILINVLTEGMHIDTSTFRYLNTLPIRKVPMLDTTEREIRNQRDTFFIEGEKEPIIMEESVELFRVKQ